MTKIIVTGPESSGKTTLCQSLSNHFNISFAEEFSREYLNKLNGKYDKSDLIKIAKGQLLKEHINKDVLIYDTDLITIKIWSKYKYGDCDHWIIEQIEKQKTEKRFYFLCKPDIPWRADPLRENQKERDEIYEIYKKELDLLSHNYFIIEGKDRFKKSLSKIVDLII